MTQNQKLTGILFAANILYILMFFMLPIDPEWFTGSVSGDGISLFGGVLAALAVLSFAHWIYCLWFLSRYDRYSGSLIWLLLLNGLYAPFYYYRVMIKKRPLKNEIPQSETAKTERNNEIEESDYAQLMRQGITAVLQLWASKGKQQELQKSAPEINITEELFHQWNDFNANKPDVLHEVFRPEERIAIKQFDRILNKHNVLFIDTYPPLQEFTASESWKEINALAKELLMKIENAGGDEGA